MLTFTFTLLLILAFSLFLFNLPAVVIGLLKCGKGKGRGGFAFLCLAMLAIGLGVFAASPKGFNGRVMIPANRQGLKIDSAWGTNIKGLKFGTFLVPPSLRTKAFVTTGSLPSTIPIVCFRNDLRVTSCPLYSVSCTTDTTTIVLDRLSVTSYTFSFDLKGP